MIKLLFLGGKKKKKRMQSIREARRGRDRSHLQWHDGRRKRRRRKNESV